MRQPLQAQFVLDLQGQHSDDLYTVCGKYTGSVGVPSEKTWRCGEGVRKGVDGRVVSIFNLFKECSFEWKWRNLNQSEDGGFEPPNKGDNPNDNDNDRVFHIGDGCTNEKMKTVYTKWGEMVTNPARKMNHGNCSSIIVRQIRLEGFEMTPISDSPTIQSSTPSESNRTTELFQGGLFIKLNMQQLSGT